MTNDRMPRKKATALPIAESTIQNEIVPLDQPPPEKEKKREKKSKHKVVAVITPDGIQGSFQSDTRRPLIAHLPIHSSDIQFHDSHLQYDPRPPCQPEAFNAGEIDPFATEATYENIPDIKKVEEKEEVAPVQTVQAVQHVQKAPLRKEYGPTTLLVQFASSKTTQQLPTETTVGCFWCCESFEGCPCVIPMRIVENTWNVYGNFCTPQCAMAYLLSEILDTHTRWERIALLNRLYNDSTNGRVYPAPAREVLSKFGGPMSSEEFRGVCNSQRIRADIHMPPMVSILASMDTKPIDFYETPLRNTFASPHQMARTVTNDEPTGLKLKRSKPLKDKESTLDTCLQLVVKN